MARPYNIQNTTSSHPTTWMAKTQTIRGLLTVLQEIDAAGYGDVPVYRADSEMGWSSASFLELYDTTDEKNRGELPTLIAFLIC